MVMLKVAAHSNPNTQAEAGDLYTVTQGGGVNFGGAVVGGMIAGDTGAIIGSREGTDTKVVDQRNALLVAEESGKTENILFTAGALSTFLCLIPEKHLETVNLNSAIITNNVNDNHVI